MISFLPLLLFALIDCVFLIEYVLNELSYRIEVAIILVFIVIDAQLMRIPIRLNYRMVKIVGMESAFCVRYKGETNREWKRWLKFISKCDL